MLSSKQREYLANCSHRWNIKTGATGSGKTYVDYLAVIPQRLLALRGQGAAVLLGNTQGTLVRNVLDPMREIWGGELVGTVSSDNTARLFGRRVHILGADSRKHVARLQGMTIEYAYGDEITTWHEDVFQMLKSRLRCPHSCFDGTCNPDSPEHWFKKFLDSDADIFCQNSTIDDGVLPPEIVQQLKAEYAGTVFYDRFILGKWALASGLVYPFVANNPAAYFLRGSTAGMDGRFYVSVDYGTHNPCSMGLWCMQRDRAVRIKEHYYDSRKTRSQHTPEEDYAMLEDLARGYYIQSVVVDPAAAAFIETIRRHGRFLVRPAENDVINGIQTTAALLQSGRVLIHESCADTLREFKTYSWDDTAHQDKVIKENDHAMDDIRYFCMTILAREYRWADWRRRV